MSLFLIAFIITVMSDQSNSIVKKQFIAGAKCPKCGILDVVQQITLTNGEIIWQCVDCDFSANNEQFPVEQENNADHAVKWR